MKRSSCFLVWIYIAKLTSNTIVSIYTLPAMYDIAAVSVYFSKVSLSAKLNWELGKGKRTVKESGSAGFRKRLASPSVPPPSYLCFFRILHCILRCSVYWVDNEGWLGRGEAGGLQASQSLFHPGLLHTSSSISFPVAAREVSEC